MTVAEDVSYEEEARRSEGSVSRPELKRGILVFIILLLDHPVRRWEYESPLICALAMIAVQQRDWRGIDRYPSLLSAAIKTSRYLVLQEAYERRPPEEGKRDRHSESDDTFESDTCSSPFPSSFQNTAHRAGLRLEDVEQMNPPFPTERHPHPTTIKIIHRAI